MQKGDHGHRYLHESEAFSKFLISNDLKKMVCEISECLHRKSGEKLSKIAEAKSMFFGNALVELTRRSYKRYGLLTNIIR